MPFFFSFFFLAIYLGFFFGLFPFQFCRFKNLAIFLECTLFVFPKFSDFFVATMRKLFRPEKKKLGYIDPKKRYQKSKGLKSSGY
jgi:hypothetical protein